MVLARSNGKGSGRKEKQLTTYDEAIRTIRSSVLLTDSDRRAIYEDNARAVYSRLTRVQST